MKVRVLPNRQLVTDAGHHYGGDTLELSDALAKRWVKLGAVEPVGTHKEPETPSQRQGRENVRKRVREELLVNAERSDREIAKAVGCDHKTVAKARRELGAKSGEEPPEA